MHGLEIRINRIAAIFKEYDSASPPSLLYRTLRRRHPLINPVYQRFRSQLNNLQVFLNPRISDADALFLAGYILMQPLPPDLTDSPQTKCFKALENLWLTEGLSDYGNFEDLGAFNALIYYFQHTPPADLDKVPAAKIAALVKNPRRLEYACNCLPSEKLTYLCAKLEDAQFEALLLSGDVRPDQDKKMAFLKIALLDRDVFDLKSGVDTTKQMQVRQWLCQLKVSDQCQLLQLLHAKFPSYLTAIELVRITGLLFSKEQPEFFNANQTFIETVLQRNQEELAIKILPLRLLVLLIKSLQERPSSAMVAEIPESTAAVLESKADRASHLSAGTIETPTLLLPALEKELKRRLDDDLLTHDFLTMEIQEIEDLFKVLPEPSRSAFGRKNTEKIFQATRDQLLETTLFEISHIMNNLSVTGETLEVQLEVLSAKIEQVKALLPYENDTWLDRKLEALILDAHESAKPIVFPLLASFSTDSLCRLAKHPIIDFSKALRYLPDEKQVKLWGALDKPFLKSEIGGNYVAFFRKIQHSEAIAPLLVSLFHDERHPLPSFYAKTSRSPVNFETMESYCLLLNPADTKLRDNYWLVTKAIMDNDPNALRYALQSRIMDERYYIPWFQLAIAKKVSPSCLQVLLNNPNFNLFGRLPNGDSLEAYIEAKVADSVSKRQYIALLEHSRKAQRDQAPNSLSYPQVTGQLPTDLYEGERKRCDELTGSDKAPWIAGDKVGEELRYRLEKIIEYLKKYLSPDSDAGALSEWDGLKSRLLGGGEGVYKIEPVDSLQLLEVLETIAIIAKQMDADPEKRRNWLLTQTEQLHLCLAGVEEALRTLINENPLATNQVLTTPYNLMKQLIDTDLSAYLKESRPMAQSVHIGAETLYNLCGLEAPEKARDRFHSEPIPAHIRHALTLKILLQLDEKFKAYSYIREKFGDYVNPEGFKLSTRNEGQHFADLCAQFLKPLGLSWEDIFDESSDGTFTLKTYQAFREGLLIDLPSMHSQDIAALKAALTGGTDEEAIAVFQKILAQPNGLLVLAEALGSLSQNPPAELKAERLLLPIPGLGGTLAMLIAANPWNGSEFLTGQRWLRPGATAPSGSTEEIHSLELLFPTEAAPINMLAIVEKWSEEKRLAFMHQLLFTPGGIRTALSFLKKASTAFLEALDHIAQRLNGQKIQHAAIDYSGSLISYLYEALEETQNSRRLAGDRVILKSLLEQFTNIEFIRRDNLFTLHLRALIDSHKLAKVKRLLLENAEYRKALLIGDPALRDQIWATLKADAKFCADYKLLLLQEVPELALSGEAAASLSKSLREFAQGRIELATPAAPPVTTTPFRGSQTETKGEPERGGVAEHKGP